MSLTERGGATHWFRGDPKLGRYLRNDEAVALAYAELKAIHPKARKR